MIINDKIQVNGNENLNNIIKDESNLNYDNNMNEKIRLFSNKLFCSGLEKFNNNKSEAYTANCLFFMF